MSTRARTASAGKKSRTMAAATTALRVAAIQMASGPSVAANLSEAEMLLEMAARQGAKLAVLPEYFAIMGLRDTDKVEARETDGKGPIQRFLAEQAKLHDMWIIGGSVPLACDAADKVRNSCLVYDNKGKRVARYDKIHLFGLQMGAEQYQEENTIEPGAEVVVLDTPFGRLGLSVCYDLRFPELYRAMHPVDLIVVPSAFTETTGKAHWEVLVRSRAIENMAYVIAAGQGGYHLNGRETHGNSMIVDPWGVILDRLPRGSGVVIATINPEYQQRLRAGLPALQHRRL